MLYQVSRSDPWYADIVNSRVTGYVPLDKKQEEAHLRKPCSPIG